MIENELYSHCKFKVVMAKVSLNHSEGTPPSLHETYCLGWGGIDSTMCFCLWDDNKSHQRLSFQDSRKERWPRTELQGRTAPWLHKLETECSSLASYMPTLLPGWHTDLSMDASVSLNASHSAFKRKVNLHPITAEATSPKKCVFIFFEFINICKNMWREKTVQ